MLNLFCCFSRRAHSAPPSTPASERAPVLDRPTPPPRPIAVRHGSSARPRIEPAPRKVQATEPAKPKAKRKPVPRVVSIDSFDGAIARQIEESFKEPARPSSKALGKRPMRYALRPSKG